MTPLEITLTTSVTTSALVGFVLWLGRNLIQERLRNAVKHEYDLKFETFRADLRKETETNLTELRSQLERQASQDLARLQKELELLKQKELSGHHERLNAYRLTVDVFAEIYSDIFIAFTQGQLVQVRDKYNRCWVRCYGYLSMVASQDVMDAFDALNDYMLKILSGRQAAQPWPETRTLALRFINCMRKDVGLAEEDVGYHGDL